MIAAGLMPTFYFHIRDESGTVRKDEQGADLTDASVARERAIQTGRQFLDKEVWADGLKPDDVARLTVEVQDDSGQIACTVPLSELFEGSQIEGSPAADATPPWDGLGRLPPDETAQ